MRNYRLFVTLFITLNLASHTLFCQNLFDSLNTIKYADYLFKGANYKDAIDEYERLVFLYKVDDPIKLRLIQSYRLVGQQELSLSRLKHLWSDPENISNQVSKEYFNLKITNRQLDSIDSKIKNNVFLSEFDRKFYLSTTYLLKEDFTNANNFLEANEYKENATLSTYHSISEDALKQKYKSPMLSGSLSTIVPGLGKFYNGHWQDGLISLTIVGTTAWQTYRGFSKHGIKSAYGWIFGFISTGFYLGNIYGSVKAANKYNKAKKDKIRIRIEATFYNDIMPY